MNDAVRVEPIGLDILDKANAVISALEASGEMAVRDLADTVHEPVSSTYRLLRSLTAIGWVDPAEARGRYRLGLAFVRIGGELEDRLDIRQIALPILKQLAEDGGLSALLCVPRARRAVCIERVAGEEVRSHAMRIGDSLPLHAGAAPLAILAFLPEAERLAIVQGAILDGNADDRLQEELAAIRIAGFALKDADVTPGIAAIGAPVYNHRGELEASLAVSGLSSQVLPEGARIAQLVVAAAQEVSEGLGWLKG